jgi:hypothetical protein
MSGMSEIDCTFTFGRVAAFRSARALRLDGVVARRPGVATQLFCVLACPRTFQVGVRQRVHFTAFGGSVTVGGRASGFAWDPRCVIETHGNLLVVTGPSPARWGFTVPLGVLPQGAVETIRGWIRDALPDATVPVPDRTPGSLLLEYDMDDALFREGQKTLISLQRKALLSGTGSPPCRWSYFRWCSSNSAYGTGPPMPCPSS